MEGTGASKTFKCNVRHRTLQRKRSGLGVPLIRQDGVETGQRDPFPKNFFFFLFLTSKPTGAQIDQVQKLQRGSAEISRETWGKKFSREVFKGLW